MRVKTNFIIAASLALALFSAARVFAQGRVLELPEGLPTSFEVAVPVSEGCLTLKLEKNPIFGKNTRFLVDDGRGGLRPIDSGLDRSYLGRVIERPDYAVSAVLTDRGLIATIIRPGKQSIRIEPAMTDGVAATHSIFVGDACPAAASAGGVAASTGPITVIRAPEPEIASAAVLASTATLPPSRVMDVREYEVGVEIGSAAFLNNYGGDLALAQSVAQGLPGNLNARYVRATGIRFRLGTVIIRTTAGSDPFTVANGNDSAGLAAFRDYWNNNPGEVGTTHDLAVYHVRGNPSGLAYVNSVGSANRYALSASNGATSWADGTITHEFGHSWNLHHTTGQEEVYDYKPRNFSGSNTAGGTGVFVSIMNGSGDHNIGRLASYEADRVYSARQNKLGYGDLVASPGLIAPFGFEDNVVVPSVPMKIDVVANDIDCNNDPLDAQLLDTVSQQGGTIALSAGTGPGGRNELLYTPPAGKVGVTDFFHYTVVDTTGRTDWGCVYVTITEEPFGEIDTTGFLADSILDWDPTTRISDGWSYGEAAAAGAAFTALPIAATGDLWIGGDASVLQGASGVPSIGQYSMTPAAASLGVRRWTSDFSGSATIQYDARRLRSGGDGCVAGIYHNGVELWSNAMAAGASPAHDAGLLELTLSVGDTLDFTIDADGTEVDDWVHFHARVMTRPAAPAMDSALLFRYAMDETILLPEGEDGLFDRRGAVVDSSGSNHHAALAQVNPASAWTTGNRANALFLKYGELGHAKVNPDGVGNGSTALTMSAWIYPVSQGEWKGIIWARGTGSHLWSIASSGYTPNAIETRFFNNRVDTPSNSIPNNAWTHVAAVWESGARFEVYLNGELVVDNPAAPIAAVDVPSWYIGTADPTRADRTWDGKLDDVELWDRALSAEEIQQIFIARRDPVISFDDAAEGAYSDGWTAGDNGGFGFGAWGTELGSGAISMGDSTDMHPAVDINAGGKSFRMVCASGYAHAWRDFGAPLGVGQTFSLKLAAGVAANNKGIDIRAFGTNGQGSFPSMFNLASRAGTQSGTWYVNTLDGQTFFSDVADANTWFDVRLTQDTLAGGTYEVTRYGTYTETITGTYSGQVGNVKVYGSTGGTTDADAIYLNDLKVAYPVEEPPPGPPSVVEYVHLGGGLFSLEVAGGDPGTIYPIGTSNLVTDAWHAVPHSDDGVNPYVLTNLEYATQVGTNRVIYVQGVGDSYFFGVGE